MSVKWTCILTFNASSIFQVTLTLYGQAPVDFRHSGCFQSDFYLINNSKNCWTVMATPCITGITYRSRVTGTEESSLCNLKVMLVAKRVQVHRQSH